MSDIIEVYLHPGEVYASGHPSMITTILGSCVAVCLRERGSAIGGVNHFVLAEQRAGDAPSARYAGAAIDQLIDHVIALGAVKSRLGAKLFGGANVLRAFADDINHIGAANIAAARRLLAQRNIPIHAEDVGGTRGRRLTFAVHDGSASVRRLGPS